MATFEQQLGDAKLRIGKYGEDQVISQQITMGPKNNPQSASDDPRTMHDTYGEYLPWFQLAHDSYYSSGGFLTGERLDKFSVAEPDDRYKVRKARAYHISIVRLLANVYVNAIYGTNIVRNFSRLPIDPTQWRGPRGSWESTMRFWLLQKVLYGGSLCGLDRKKPDPIRTLQDENENALCPFVISPLRAIDWSLNGTEFAWVKILEKPGFNRGLDWRNPRNVADSVKVWTPNDWHRFDEVTTGWDEVIGDNTLGQVPIVPMIGDYPEDPGSFYGATDFLQVAKINLRMFNLFSEGDDQMASSALNILTVPVREGYKASIQEIGGGVGLEYDPTLGAAPQFISIDSGPVQLVFENLEFLRAAAFEVARLGGSSTSRKPATAVQKIFENEEAEKSIRSYAKSAEAAERDLIRIGLKFSGHDPKKYEDILNDPETLQFPLKYDLNVLRENYMSMAIQALSIHWSSEEARKYYEKYFATSLIPMDNATRKTIIDQIKAGDGIVSIQQTNAQNIKRPVTDHNQISPETQDGAQANVSTSPREKEMKQ